jgi:hypothetical protein
MSFRPKHSFFYAAAAVLLFAAGWSCGKFGNKSGISNSQVVATVGGHNITFGDWMKQMDLLRVFSTAVDPDNAEQVKAVLDSLIDQELVLSAAQKANYHDAEFDEALKTRLVQAEIKVKEIKEKLEKDRETVQRIEKNYEAAYKKMLLARQYASSRVNDVTVTSKDLRDWYDDYALKAKRAGQQLPPFEKVKREIEPSVKAEKFLSALQAEAKVERKQEIIEKYLTSLSTSRQMLDSKGGELPSMDGGKK